MKTEEILNDELNKAKNKKILTTYIFENEKLYELTKENVINIETMLLYNPRYSNFNDINISVTNFVTNSAEYLINETSTSLIRLIKNGLENEKIFKTEYNIKDGVNGNLIFHILRKLNQENSTRASIKDIKNMTRKIGKECNYCIEKLFSILENTEEGHNLIGNLTVIEGSNENFSLATKFCHYTCINYFNDSKRRDNYSIYDNIVAKSIHKYFKRELIKKDIKYNEFSNIEKDTLKNDIKNITDIEKRQDKYIEFYKNFQKLIDDIIDVASEKHKQKINRNGFDHILWYTNK